MQSLHAVGCVYVRCMFVGVFWACRLDILQNMALDKNSAVNLDM